MFRTNAALAAAMMMVAGLNAPLSAQTQPTQPDKNQPTKPTPPIHDPERDKRLDDKNRDNDKSRDKAWMNDQMGDMHTWLRKLEGNWTLKIETFDSDAGGLRGWTEHNANDPTDPARDPARDPANRDKDRKDNPPGKDNLPGKDSPVKDPAKDALKDRDGKRDPSDKRMMGDHTGTARTEMMYGGRVAHMMVNCNEESGRPFEGVWVLAYDAPAQRFESVWFDSRHTGLTTMNGQLDSDKKTLSLSGECTDPKSGRTVTKREVTRWINDNQFVTEIYAPGTDSTDKKAMVITFTRGSGNVTSVPDHTRPNEK